MALAVAVARKTNRLLAPSRLLDEVVLLFLRRLASAVSRVCFRWDDPRPTSRLLLPDATVSVKMALVLRWPTRRRRRSLQTRWPKQPVRLVALYLCPSCWKKTRSWPDWDWDQEVPLWVPCSSVATSRRRCRPSRTIWRPSSWNGATSSPPLSTARILTWPPFNASLTWAPLVMFFSCSPPATLFFWLSIVDNEKLRPVLTESKQGSEQLGLSPSTVFIYSSALSP